MEQSKSFNTPTGHYRLVQNEKGSPIFYLHLELIACRCPFAPVIHVVNEKGQGMANCLICNTHCPHAELSTAAGEDGEHFYTISCAGSPLRRKVELQLCSLIEQPASIVAPMSRV